MSCVIGVADAFCAVDVSGAVVGSSVDVDVINDAVFGSVTFVV